MLDKIRNLQNEYARHPVVEQLRDVRSIGLVVFAIIVLLVSWSGVKAIQTNYRLEQQILRLRQENSIKQLQNENQRLKNEYLKTPQYLELSLRQDFGLAKAGETELLVPKDVAMSHVKGVKAVEPETVATTAAKDRSDMPFYQRNMQAWLDFFLHRDSGV